MTIALFAVLAVLNVADICYTSKILATGATV